MEFVSLATGLKLAYKYKCIWTYLNHDRKYFFIFRT